MDSTANYGLKKPGDADGADISAISENMDTIDAELKKAGDHRADASIHLQSGERDKITGAVQSGTIGAANGVASLGADGKVPKSQLPTTGGYVRQGTAPADTSLLWVDSANGNVMKYYNGTAWAPVPATWG